MRFTITVSYLFVAVATIATLSVEATSLRRNQGARPVNSRRDLYQSQYSNGYNNGYNNRYNNAYDDATNDDASDDYVFYDDYAIQNCNDDDENCQKAATYAGYSDDYIANCNDDDEDCIDAAAYMAAWQQNKTAAQETTGPWNIQTYTDKYNSMSRSSQIWTIVLICWFSVLIITTSYFCCCRDRYQSQKRRKKSLREALMGGKSDGDESGSSRKRGKSKFKFFGRKSRS